MSIARKNENTVFYLILAFIAVMCLLASAVPPAQSQPPTNLEPYRSICEINVPGEGQGSGTLIATREDLGLGLVLSCRHVCLKPNQRLEIEWLWAKAGKSRGVTLAVVQGRDFSTDMALAVCELPPGIKPLPVRQFDSAAGPWTAAGFRNDALHVAGPVERVNYNGKTIATENVFKGGMSGGPMMNRYGEVVGIVVASDGKAFSLCSDGPAMKALINRFLLAETAEDFRNLAVNSR